MKHDERSFITLDTAVGLVLVSGIVAWMINSAMWF